MKKIQFTREERIINALMIHSYSLTDIGVLHGKMGVVLYFFHLGKIKNNSVFTSFAEELLDNVVELLHNKLSIDFDRGITGIGWAVEYLIQNGYVEANADEVLEDIDPKVNQELIHNTQKSIDTLISIGYYYISRLHYRVNQEDDIKVLDIKYNIILFVDEIERYIENGDTHPQLYHLLLELKKLNIFNYKVDQLLSKTDIDTTNYIFPFIPQLSKEDAESLVNSRDVKSSHAGFELKGTPEENKFGLKDGIAGIGLQIILNKL